MTLEYKYAPWPISVAKGRSATGDAARTVSGWITTFGPPADFDGDIVDEGAFDRHFRQYGYRVPCLSGHDPQQMIGWHQLKKVPGRGVWTDCELLKGIPLADEDLIRVKSGAMAFSIGFHTERDEPRKDARWLMDITLLEASIVLLPANPRATIEQRAAGDEKTLKQSLDKLLGTIRSLNATVRGTRSTDPAARLDRISHLLRELSQ